MNTKGTILVVDDTPADLKLLVDTLTAEGYQVLPANNGELALNSIVTGSPELILLDVHVPGREGFEVLRRLLERPESRDIPVVLISASGESAQRVEGLKLGAVDYITKPFQREELLARVQTHLKLRRLQVRLEQQAASLQQAHAQFQTDLVERKRAEEKLQESEARLRAITDSAQDAILMMGPDGRISYWNPAAERILGYPSTEALGQNLHHLIAPPHFQPAHDAAFPAFRQTGQGNAIGKTLDLEARRKDGRKIFVQLSLSAVQIDGDWHAVGIVRDITERKRMEDQLLQLSRAVEQSPTSIVITNPAGNIEYVNPKFIEVTGYTLTEVLGRNPRVLKSGEKSPEAYRELWQTLMAGKVWRGEFHNKKKNGELYWESASISPIRDAAGRTTHYVAVKEDITARKQTEAERDQLIQDLQQALARVKSLSGLLPICAGCKRIRDDQGYWSRVESYIQQHSEATFTHGMCPDCIEKYYPDLLEPGPGLD